MKFAPVLGSLFVLVGIATAQTAPASASPSAATGNTYILAHLPRDGGWGWRVLAGNSTSSPVTAMISFFNQSGETTSVPVVTQAAGVSGIFGTEFAGTLAAPSSATGSVSLSLPPNGISMVSADPSLRNASSMASVAWGTITSSVPLDVLTVFDFANGTAVATAVGAQSLPAAKSFRFPVTINGPFRYSAGVAVANPNNAVSNLRLNLMTEGGNPKAIHKRQIGPNSQQLLVLTASDVFGVVFTDNSLFVGTVQVCSDVPIGLVALGVEAGLTPSSGTFFSEAVTTEPCTL